eukprot:1752180-Prymnesium_polylepis.1
MSAAAAPAPAAAPKRRTLSFGRKKERGTNHGSSGPTPTTSQPFTVPVTGFGPTTGSGFGHDTAFEDAARTQAAVMEQFSSPYQGQSSYQGQASPYQANSYGASPHQQPAADDQA